MLREAGGVALVSLQGAPDLRPKVVRALVQNGIDLLRIDRGRGPPRIDLPAADQGRNDNGELPQ